MNPQRRSALALMIVFALFALAMTVNLAATYRAEQRAGVLAEGEFQKLKEQAKADPKNTALI